jgi:uncharacterized protein
MTGAAPLAQLASLRGHVFWPDDISLTDADGFGPAKMLTAGQVADSYLVALAVSKSGRLATFDRRLSAVAVDEGAKSLHLIGA